MVQIGSPPGTLKAVRLPFTKSYITTPDRAEHTVVGQLNIKTLINPRDFNPVGSNVIVSKMSDANTGSWALMIQPGLKPSIRWIENAGSSRSADSTAALPLTDPYWIWASINLNSGGNTVLDFYTALYEKNNALPGGWNRLGDAVVIAGVTTIKVSTLSIRISGFPTTNFYAVPGLYKRIKVDSSTNICDFNTGYSKIGDTSFGSVIAGETWSLFEEAQIVEGFAETQLTL